MMDGVVRSPSAFSITLILSPSRIATQELVVPRSIPIILPMFCSDLSVTFKRSKTVQLAVVHLYGCGRTFFNCRVNLLLPSPWPDAPNGRSASTLSVPRLRPYWDQHPLPAPWTWPDDVPG